MLKQRHAHASRAGTWLVTVEDDSVDVVSLGVIQSLLYRVY